MTNTLLSASEQAHVNAVRSRGASTHQGYVADILSTSTTTGIDWRVIHALIPWFSAFVAWLWWAFFLLIPSVFGLHYAGMMPAMNNAAYTMMGLTLCLAATVAAQSQHGVRAIAFTFSVLLLAYWF